MIFLVFIDLKSLFVYFISLLIEEITIELYICFSQKTQKENQNINERKTIKNNLDKNIFHFYKNDEYDLHHE